VRHVDANMRVVRLFDDSLRRPVEGKARHQQIVVSAPRSRTHNDFDLSGRHRPVLGAERNAHCRAALPVGIDFARRHPPALGVNRGGARAHRIEPRKFHLLVVREAHAVETQQPDHVLDVAVRVLCIGFAIFTARQGRRGGVRHARLESFLGRFRCAHDRGRTVVEREFLRLHRFDREWTGHAHHTGPRLGLVHELFLLGICLDTGVHLVHLSAPCGAISGHGFLQ
jgi:hypothetical protein